MSEDSILTTCFKSLNERIYEIRYNICPRKNEFQKSIVDEIVENGIYGFKEEDVIDDINALLPDIEGLINDIDTILVEQDIKPIIERNLEFPFQESIKLSVEEVKAQLKSDILLELEYYTKRLNELNNVLENRLKRKGTNKFANAGKKMKLMLTVEQIGSLFGLLLELDYIKLEDGINKPEIKELATFLSKNFLSKNVTKTLSISNLESSLQKDKRDSAKISKLLKDLKSK